MSADPLAAALGATAARPSSVAAGNVNTGAVDPSVTSRRSHAAGAWVHVDGAFGLWASAPGAPAPDGGVERADSWASDAHKWLNVPYDCGLAFVADPEAHRAAMTVTAAT